MVTSFDSKFEKHKTPDSALSDLECLIEFFEEAESDKQRNWAQNRLIALRRVFIHALHEFINTAITYDLEDFAPWLEATRKLINLSEYGVPDSEVLKEVQINLINSLKNNLKLELGEKELAELISIMDKDQL